MPPPFLIAIDGPAGAGKSTVAKALARCLSFLYLDTGALYRALALKAQREGIPSADAAALDSLCERTKIDLLQGDAGMRVLLDGEDVTSKIRGEPISILASAISAHGPVRKALLSVQRRVAEQGSLVAEGRDMGTVVFPEADVKFYLDAAPEERALRRYRELEHSHENVNLDSVHQDLQKRDRQDRLRSVAPLRIAEGSHVIDCSLLTAEEVVEEMLCEVGRRQRNRRKCRED
ncbi:MAG: cytidylate kinase [Deltaproteobacteria bacterium HGW-Deltaproteobacteria-19]|nr:MAG: cytidylate kinase [Deltaproteobacteria bacterium HGW-Deltaproteobacteria-19]